MAEVQWSQEDGRNYGELPNDEYVEYWLDEGYRITRWSATATLAEAVEGASLFLGDLSNASIVLNEGGGLKYVDLQTLLRKAGEGGGEYCRLDANNRALLWSGPISDVESDAPEYAECSTMVVPDDTADLEEIMKATATPEVRALAEMLVRQMVLSPVAS